MTDRTALGWSQLRHLRVGLYGMGREGTANLRKLRSLGVEPLIVADVPKASYGENIVATAAGGLEALERCDVVVKTPGISRYRPEIRHLDACGVPVLGGLGLWLQEADLDRVVCVSGTKGKSTTASLIAHLLNGFGRRSVVVGNIGVPPYDPATPDVDGFDHWVVEVSSHQAPDLASCPPVAALTALHPDHLTWHGDVETYFRDKLSLFSRPGAALTVANGDSDLIRNRRPLLGPQVDWVSEKDAPGELWLNHPALPGNHNRRNALIARRCLAGLGIAEAQDDDALSAVLRSFRGLPSRLTVIGVVDGVEFVDDSLSTNVLPTLAALDVYAGRRVALIVGGHDRGIDYTPLAERVDARGAPTLVLTVPDNGPRISAAFAESGAAPTTDCASLAEAVALGFAWARPDGVVLLSPAAPSFGVFRDYRERAEAFAREMNISGSRAAAPPPRPPS
jgi:UDP-N-acetylmuramoyl-L-alanine---L-glutamate ligase